MTYTQHGSTLVNALFPKISIQNLHYILYTFPMVLTRQGVKLIFFSDSHMAPKFFKVAANSRKVGRHFQRQTKPLFYAVIVLEIK